MVAFTVLLALLVVLNKVTESNVFNNRVFSNLKRLCPAQYVGVNNDGVNKTSTIGSCCTDDFSDIQTFDLHPNRIRPDQSCLFPRLYRFEPDTMQTMRSYSIVIEAPEGGCVAQNNLSNIPANLINFPTCNDTDIHDSLRRFLPVYSHESRLIYKNPHCAICHGQVNFEQWQVIASSTFYAILSNDKMNCNFDFVYLGNKNDLKHLECFTKTYSSCPEKNTYNIPSDVDLSVSELKQACAVDYLPYFENIYYAKNVFCFICHYDFITKGLSNECVSLLGLEQDRTTSKKTFVRILDNNVKNQEALSKTKLIKDIDYICGLDVDEKVCVPVLCPLGQVMIADGERRTCKMDSTLWISSPFVLTLFLEFDEAISINQNSIDKIFTKTAFWRSWSTNWTTVSYLIPKILFNSTSAIQNFELNATVGQSIEIINHVFVDLVYYQSKIAPSNFIETITKTLSKTWIFTMNKTKMRVRQSLSESSFRYVAVRLPQSPLRESLYLSSRQFISSQPGVLYRTLVWNNIRRRAIVFTSNFLCKMIELGMHNFHTITYESSVVAVYHNRTGKYFYDREFILGFDSNRMKTIKVCIADITNDKSNNCSHWQLACSLYVLLLTAVSGWKLF